MEVVDLSQEKHNKLNDHQEKYAMTLVVNLLNKSEVAYEQCRGKALEEHVNNAPDK